MSVGDPCPALTFVKTYPPNRISLVSGLLSEFKLMAEHSPVQTTQRYIDGDSESQRKVVDLI